MSRKNEQRQEFEAEAIRELNELLRAHAPQAGERLHALFHERLLRFARGYLGSVADAEDGVQDVFVKLLAAPRPPQHLRAWLYKVARNHCLNLRRSRGRRKDAEPLPAEPPSAATWTGQLTRLLRAEQRSRVAELVASLSEHHREVLIMRYVEGLSRAEVADVLDLPESVVKSRLYEGLTKLREHTSLME